MEQQPKSLDEKMGGNTQKEKLLPFFHSCDAFVFRKILKDRALSPSICDVFNEELLYLYYGRPAYKSSITSNNRLDAFLPVSFILKSEQIQDQDITRIAPFDTGAYKNNLYKDYLHPKMEMSSFFMQPDQAAIHNMVHRFFASNKEYFSGKPKVGVEFDPLEFEMQAYYALINGVAQSSIDDRKATIEVQLSRPLELTRDTLEAVILPEHFLSAPLVTDVLHDGCQAELITYESFGIQSGHYYTERLRLTKEYLIRKNYIHGH
jgi:hypothetical protein